ncbi:MAG TPA: phosphatidate cytidylyltransferase [Candidatus Binataceae bacterium]|nr:phosphatidate cytidylyltransferase [Candidatus Binataceae bacterium]
MLRTRLWTAAVALPLLLGVVLWAPAAIFTGFIAILTAIGLYEVAAMTKARGDAMVILIILGASASIPMLMHVAVYSWIVPAFIGAGMIGLTVRVGRRGSDAVAVNPILIALGALWVGVLFPYFALLRNAPHGVGAIILMILLVVASDSGAYFVGRSIGRIKLLPRVSPNKTVEGAIGGLAAVIVAAVILRPWLVPEWTARSAILIGLGIGVLAQAGDLANSAFKRVAGVKDSGWLFPGHGGLMDRACSLVFAAVLTYYCLD